MDCDNGKQRALGLRPRSPGDTQDHVYAAQFMIDELENIGLTALVFATMEFLDSANEPLKRDSTADLSKVA